MHSYMFPLLVFGLSLALSSCNFRESEAETIKQFHLCKKLANNGNCDVDCLGFDSLETDDCKGVEFEAQSYRIIVNAHPFMHSVESWKIVRETAEKRFYRMNLTIDITEEQYRNITNHCMKLIREFKSSTTGEPSIFEYCPVEVNATFFVPQVQSQAVFDLQKECQKRDNNGICDLMCRRLEEYTKYEEADCKDEEFPWNYAYDVTIFLTKQELLRPSNFWSSEIEAIFRRKYDIEVTSYFIHQLSSDDVQETMKSEKKHLERHVFISFLYSQNSTLSYNWGNWYVYKSEALEAHSHEELDTLSRAIDRHL